MGSPRDNEGTEAYLTDGMNLCKCKTAGIGCALGLRECGDMVWKRAVEIHIECHKLRKRSERKIDSRHRANKLHSVAKKREKGTFAGGDVFCTRTCTQTAERRLRVRELQNELRCLARDADLPLCVVTQAKFLCEKVRRKEVHPRSES